MFCGIISSTTCGPVIGCVCIITRIYTTSSNEACRSATLPITPVPGYKSTNSSPGWKFSSSSIQRHTFSGLAPTNPFLSVIGSIVKYLGVVCFPFFSGISAR